ncbi:MAG: F0F1 ATP synthase subunit B [Rikenellaceae bacterium]
MSLLLPDAGLLFWMVISFGLVFFIVAKYGFPVIVKMVEERRAYIQKSLDDARIANAHLDNLKAESDAIIASAREEHVKILREANLIKESIINSAKQEAKELTARQIEEAKRELEKERESSLKKIRTQIAALSVEVAEKIVRTELKKTPAQMDMINRFLEESSEMRS